MEFESIFSEVKEKEAAKEKEQKQKLAQQQLQGARATTTAGVSSAERRGTQSTTPSFVRQMSTPVSGGVPSEKTLVKVMLPEGTKLDEIHDDSVVTLNVHTGYVRHQVRIGGAGLKREVLKNNPGVANGTHEGALVLEIAMPSEAELQRRAEQEKRRLEMVRRCQVTHLYVHYSLKD